MTANLELIDYMAVAHMLSQLFHQPYLHACAISFGVELSLVVVEVHKLGLS